ncbi:hypothetical protein ACQP2U_10365 [Nocardia sp. CA-084685]|uniref:hypothetical protein n=1 Tax=Nocardia sp. CA-084685 TaxID=3239970 RepID=UPI003D987DA0
MSDRSVEDELAAEARKFSTSMRAAMRHYAQASNWLDRRRARREISLITRQEAREQQAARQRHLVYSEQAVDKYRVHALAVNQRANDPTVDHTRRFRDQQVLARHRADMRDLLLRNPHLSEVEKGIALDGLDAATAFPEFETGELFNRAHKVKGIEALRYRAQVAREVSYQPNTQGAGRESAQRAARTSEQTAQLSREGEPLRFVAELGWNSPAADRARAARTGRAVSWRPVAVERREFASEEAATEWLKHAVAEGRWPKGISLSTHVVDNQASSVHDRITHWSYGEPQALTDKLNDRIDVLTDRRTAEQEHTHAASRESDRRDSAERVDGPLGMGTDEGRTDHTPFGDPDRNGRPARSTGRDRQDFAAERDSLKARLNLSIEHNSELADSNAQLTRQLTALSAERDQLLSERDEAVRKLAERTPAEQRYGSPERQAEQARNQTREATEAATEPGPRSPLADYQPGQALADAVARNGRDREGMER